MRRSAKCLSAALIVLPLAGCSSLFHWKKADQTADASYPPEMTTTGASQNYYPPPDTRTSGRTHVVQRKETLYSIARMYYNGDHHRWRDIYEANKSEIPDPNKIRVGQSLVIP